MQVPIISELGNALRSLIALRGISGLWQGLTPTLLRDVPFSGVYWGVYESIKAYYSVTVPEVTFTFFSGAIAGSVRYRIEFVSLIANPAYNSE